ncbi:MAG: hypothetical protein ACLPND_17600 [Candidatus Korobacteraceae bacterium]
MKRLRQVSYVGAGIFLTAALVALDIYIGNIRTRRNAEELLMAIRQLRVGESTLSTTENIRMKFRAIKLNVSPVSGSPAEQRFQILVSNPWNKSKYMFPNLWQFGLRPSEVVVELRYQEERLISLSYMIDTPVFTSLGEPVELVAGTAVGENRDVEPKPNLSAIYTIRPSFLIAKALQVRLGGVLTSRATQEEHDAAFDFDLSCISSLHGCEAFCQVMPSVWREAARTYENKGIPLVQELLKNPRCPAH